jgi:acetoacetyl-CoA synthetase
MTAGDRPAPPPTTPAQEEDTSCLVPLKPGDGAPFFIVHGLVGAVLELRALGRRMTIDGAVYAIQARGLDGVAAPLDRIEDMAASYLTEIRAVQPRGPYRLAGFSFGGLVALEMARLLLATGETVAFLGLLDTYPHPRFWPWRCRAAAWWKLARFWLSGAMWRRIWRHYADEWRGLPPGARPAYLARRLRAVALLPFNLMFLRRFIAAERPPTAEDPTMTPAVERVRQAGNAALAAYRPAAYAGDITFVKAADETNLPFEANLLWRTLAREVTVLAVPGDHVGMVRGGVAALAAVLSAALSPACPTPHPGRGWQGAEGGRAWPDSGHAKEAPFDCKLAVKPEFI